MANIYQQAVSQRKIIYLSSILVLLVCTLFVRGIVKVPLPGLKEKLYAKSIDGQARKHELTELSQGDAELASSTARLLLTGSRGFAVCALWINANEKQRKHEWSELDVSVKSITKLQPHFMSPWLFQSWNIAYNVSVEMDRLNDMYFYIARGITIIAEGDHLNRNNPDLRYWVAFYYQNKFGSSDKVTTLRCLHQMSCMPDEDRDPANLMNPNGTIDHAKFEEFCRKNPQFIRRLKETRIIVDGSEEKARPLCYTPNEVLTFLRNNRKLPSRYKPGTRELLDRLQQFPVLPDMTNAPDEAKELSFRKDLADEDTDAFLVARGWYAHSLNAVPPPIPIPGARAVDYDPYLYRYPKKPALIIFRQGPMRAQSYHAERLTKEGWFDKRDPWEIDELSTEQQGGGEVVWIPKKDDQGKPISAAFTTPLSAQDAWRTAAQRWREHGERTGLYMDSARMKTYLEKAEYYMRLHPNITLGTMTDPITAEEAADPEKAEAHAAHSIMFNLIFDRNMTNYEAFDLEAQGMSTDEAILAKKLLAKADKYRLEVREKLAQPLYEQGFDAWKKALARQDCRARRAIDPSQVNQACRDFRDLERYQEEMYEHNVRYTKIMDDLDRENRRGYRRMLNDTVMAVAGLNGGSPLTWASSLSVLAQDAVVGKDAEGKDVKKPISDVARLCAGMRLPGPLDGLAPDGTPWINEEVLMKVRVKYGLMARPAMAMPTPNPEAGGPAPKQ